MKRRIVFSETDSTCAAAPRLMYLGRRGETTWSLPDSNPQPLRCKRSALPIALGPLPLHFVTSWRFAGPAYGMVERGPNLLAPAPGRVGTGVGMRDGHVECVAAPLGRGTVQGDRGMPSSCRKLIASSWSLAVSPSRDLASWVYGRSLRPSPASSWPTTSTRRRLSGATSSLCALTSNGSANWGQVGRSRTTAGKATTR